jgi:hypothetical protein
MTKKPNIKAQIKDSGSCIKDVMQNGLANIIGSMIAQIMGKSKGLPESQKMNAIKNIKPKGINQYKNDLLAAMAVVAADGLKQARKEVPKASKVKLSGWSEESLMMGEFESLPSKVKTRIYNQMQLLIGTQVADVEKTLYFQYGHSVDSTDSDDQIEKDLTDAGAEYAEGSAIASGSSVCAAQVINEARSAFFFNDDTLDEIDAFQFVNADPVSDICQDLAGTVFAKNDPNIDRYQPPLHFNCKSYIVPILKGNLGDREIEDFKPSSKKLEDQIQFCEHFSNMSL